MAYDGEDDCVVPRINRFSNPGVEYLDEATGDEDHNNAQTIRENMVRLFKSTTHVSSLRWREQLILRRQGPFRTLTFSSRGGWVVLGPRQNFLAKPGPAHEGRPCVKFFADAGRSSAMHGAGGSVDLGTPLKLPAWPTVPSVLCVDLLHTSFLFQVVVSQFRGCVRDGTDCERDSECCSDMCLEDVCGKLQNAAFMADEAGRVVEILMQRTHVGRNDIYPRSLKTSRARLDSFPIPTPILCDVSGCERLE